MLDNLACGLDIDDSLEELEDSFEEQNITLILNKIGLLANRTKCIVERFEKFIFLRSNQDEIYDRQERKFIENVDKIYVYPDYYKRTKKGIMSCHIIAADLSDASEPVYNGVAFMKIVNKSLPGFVIFLLKLNDGLHFGCRLFENDEWNDCTLSETGYFRQIVSEIFWCYDGSDFISYYSSLVEIISQRFGTADIPDYDEEIRKRRGINDSYLDLMYLIQYDCKIDTSEERQRYINSFDKKFEYNFQQELSWCLEELKNIKSTQVNTLEMLFDAEELEKLISEKYQKNQDIIVKLEPEEQDSSSVDIYEQYRDNPEMVIKMLKIQKGIN
ncbi:hypothetical protein LY28_02939 [Ruminiclostridium sufflavum DSM 19573]|uniref:Uncharacterized protein n=1 Tax=Ruminiclostridium sufflavum DSM 19573 TaxID=1121337 RepID=A0A318XJG7_9FIRM|nr:hypothetical protein [Ruminiclostridium sufflavum]PYG86598.1 hypothetical protein LY28_02939 [Ruminiclostridium sufflavum DSM 19573]